MTSTEYTPGPWAWTIHDHSCASLGVGDSPGMGTPLVMSVSPCRSCADAATKGEWKWGRCTTPNEANARLIAAAPDLLEAAKHIGSILASRPKTIKDDELWGAFSHIVAAVAKAEGRK